MVLGTAQVWGRRVRGWVWREDSGAGERRGRPQTLAPAAEAPEPELPYLDLASRVSLSDVDAAAAKTEAPLRPPENPAGSPFFARLPCEIRRAILVAAFGGGRVHMDLRWDLPLLPRERRTPTTELCGQFPHAGPPAPHGGFTADLQPESRHYVASRSLRQGGLDEWQRRTARRTPLWARALPPLAWQWWGCVCHREPPWALRVPWQRDLDFVSGPWKDECLVGWAPWCGAAGGGSCHVGCMGWLQSCRQAYIEGIEVLYATNTLILCDDHRKDDFYVKCFSHIRHDLLMDALLLGEQAAGAELLGGGAMPAGSCPPRALILPASLAMVTRLELDWDLGLFLPPEQHAKEADQRAVLQRRLALLPRTFPALQRLAVSFRKGSYGRVPKVSYGVIYTVSDEMLCLMADEMHLVLLVPHHAMAQQLPRLEHMAVYLPFWPSQSLMDWAARRGLYLEPDEGRYRKRFWWAPERANAADENKDARDIVASQALPRTPRNGFWVCVSARG